jgi:hypothetical protein
MAVPYHDLRPATPIQQEAYWTETFGCQRNMRSDNFKEDQIRRKRSFGRNVRIMSCFTAWFRCDWLYRRWNLNL